jgi:hypothetical protein
MKGKGSAILMTLGLVFSGGWSARAEPPVTLSADEITEEEDSGAPSLRQPPPGNVMDHEQGLQENHVVVHQDISDTHHHGSTAGEHMMGAEGVGSHSEDLVGPMGNGNVEHSRMHDAGTMGEPDRGIMGGGPREGMMGSGAARDSAGGMHGSH